MNRLFEFQNEERMAARRLSIHSSLGHLTVGVSVKQHFHDVLAAPNPDFSLSDCNEPIAVLSQCDGGFAVTGQ